jgi:hypothetical protein
VGRFEPHPGLGEDFDVAVDGAAGDAELTRRLLGRHRPARFQQPDQGQQSTHPHGVILPRARRAAGLLTLADRVGWDGPGTDEDARRRRAYPEIRL